MAWTEENNDIFSIRSAYKLITNTKKLNLGESSMTQQQKLLWKMKQLQKIKIFTRRACRDCLPIAQNLRKKNIDIDDVCVFCQQPENGLAHALFYRTTIYQWWCNHMNLFFNMEHMSNISNIAGQIIGKGDYEVLEKKNSTLHGSSVVEATKCILSTDLLNQLRPLKVHQLLRRASRNLYPYQLTQTSTKVACKPPANKFL